MEPDALRVPLDNYDMQLRHSEVASVAAGLADVDASDEAGLLTIVSAVRRLPVRDRAPLWELALRHYGRRTPVDQAAGEIGMDALHAAELLDAFRRALSQG